MERGWGANLVNQGAGRRVHHAEWCYMFGIFVGGGQDTDGKRLGLGRI